MSDYKPEMPIVRQCDGKKADGDLCLFIADVRAFKTIVPDIFKCPVCGSLTGTTRPIGDREFVPGVHNPTLHKLKI